MSPKVKRNFKTKPIITRNLVQLLGFGALSGITLLTMFLIFLLVGVIIVRGASAITFDFIFGYPSNGMKAGGIWPAIVGTIYLILGSAIFSVPLGIGASIYLSEYAPDNRLTQIIRIAIITLAGIPSVVYGLFGLGLFVLYMNMGTSILAGSLTLAIMNLPVIISTTEEAHAFRPASFSSGQHLIGRNPLADHPAYHPAASVAWYDYRCDPGIGTSSRRDRADFIHRSSILPAPPASFTLRPDHGTALPPVCHLDPGTRDAAGDPVRHSAGFIGAGAWV